MRCATCTQGEHAAGTATVTINRGDTTVIINKLARREAPLRDASVEALLPETTQPGTTTVTLEREATTVVIKGVSALVCGK
jgi:hypothetical protein